MAFKSIGPVKFTFGGVEFTGVAKVYDIEYLSTEAARMISALPPVRFPGNRAGQLGNRCVQELSRLFPSEPA